jgi:HK97 family phage prohead protease
MPYFITDKAEGCSGWATIKDDGEIMGCHTTKQDAIDQMVAISISEDIEVGGERKKHKMKKPKPLMTGYRELPDNYRPALAEDVPEGRACGNCMFYDEDRVNEAGDKAWCEKWDEFVDGGFYCNAWQSDDDMDDMDDEEDDLRAINQAAPAFMRAAARRGLAFYADGKGGDGLVDRTIREARLMAEGNVSDDKWIRIAAWIARHMSDLDAPAANPSDENYPSAGVVAHFLWGSGASKQQAMRTQNYAERVVERIRAQEEDRNTLQNDKWKSIALNLNKDERQQMTTQVERRVNTVEFDVRNGEASSDGMSFTGYAAVFNSPSEPLPFTEVIKEGAFKRSLKSRNEVKLFMNHNTDVVLGSTRAGTLRLTEDSRGLLAQADLPDTSAGRDLSVLMKRGDVSSMSFGFSVPPKGDAWSKDGATRELHQIRLHEVSIVTGFPAYAATTASVRSLDILATRTAVDVDALSDAITRLEAGETLEPEHADLISEVVSKLRATEPANLALLELKRKQLDLMAKVF